MKELPSFSSTSVIGRKAKRITLDCNDEHREAMNIIHKEEIKDRICDFAERVANPILHGVDATIVPILNGAINFYAELSHCITEASHVELMPVSVRSYGIGELSQEVIVNKEMIREEKVANRIIILIDDVLETGATAAEMKCLLESYGAKEVISVFLVRKMRKETQAIDPNYWLFEVHPESWIFGYGMDMAEKFRHLRFICDNKMHLYDSDGRPKY